MILETLVIVSVLLLGLGAFAWWLNKKMQPTTTQQQLENMVNQIFGMSTQKIVEQSKQVLSSEKEAIRVDLENKQRTIEKLVTTLQDEMRQRQVEIRSFEQDRTKQFGELTSTLENHRKFAEDLRISTQQLANVLSNNQTRGQWGERIIEDLLHANGLIEGVHFVKQTKLTATTLRPDITLLLPNKRNVPVDVKFPYAEIQKMAIADNKAAKEAHLKQFASDLRTKVAKVAEYINPEYQTMDYAILFVPNEMVFSFINQRFPDIIDDAMAKRVMIVSPFSFLAVARIVIESYRNFMIEDKLQDIIRYVSEFTNEWGAFKEEFGKFGRSIESLQKGYETMTKTRTNQMEKKIKKIESYQATPLLQSKHKTQPLELLGEEL